MSKKANPTAIGVFVIAATLIGVVGIIVLGSGQLFRESTPYLLHFSGDLSGLDKGAPVSFQGVTVGKVTDVSIIYDHATDEISRQVMIEMQRSAFVQRNIEEEGPEGSLMTKHIEQGLRAQLASQSLVTGKLKVSLGYYPDTEAELRAKTTEVAEIPTIPAVFDSLAQRIGDLPLEQIVHDLSEATKGISTLVNSGDLEQTLDGLKEMMTSIKDLMEAPELREALVSLDDTLSSIDGLMESPELRQALVSLDETMGTINEVVKSDEFGGMTASIDQTLKETQKLMREMQEGADPVRRELLTAVDSITDAARVAQSLLEYLQRHPEALIKGKGSE